MDIPEGIAVGPSGEAAFATSKSFPPGWGKEEAVEGPPGVDPKLETGLDEAGALCHLGLAGISGAQGPIGPGTQGRGVGVDTLERSFSEGIQQVSRDEEQGIPEAAILFRRRVDDTRIKS